MQRTTLGGVLDPGDHDDGQLPEDRVGLDLGKGLEAVLAWHQDVEQDQVEGLRRAAPPSPPRHRPRRGPHGHGPRAPARAPCGSSRRPRRRGSGRDPARMSLTRPPSVGLAPARARPPAPRRRPRGRPEQLDAVEVAGPPALLDRSRRPRRRATPPRLRLLPFSVCAGGRGRRRRRPPARRESPLPARRRPPGMRRRAHRRTPGRCRRVARAWPSATWSSASGSAALRSCSRRGWPRGRRSSSSTRIGLLM